MPRSYFVKKKSIVIDEANNCGSMLLETITELITGQEGFSLTSEMSSVDGLLANLFDSSNVGVAVLDDQLRYLALNISLADMHGVPAECHLGKTVREILGDRACWVERGCNEVLATGRPVLSLEVAGINPSEAEAGRWVLFPMNSEDGAVKQVCAVVVESPAKVDREEMENQSSSHAVDTMLRSWKEIACYLGTCVKTVQRWEQTYNLPVRRLKASKGSVVFSFKKELDQWMHSKTRNPQQITK
ncbi:MAG: two-component hybrid sensor and regulator [Acidobacteriaceae bacterium]|nr:two-component hybrid sensor and regulator [Acidobacteriaceae bacterium]